jgi:hypothetical protein
VAARLTIDLAQRRARLAQRHHLAPAHRATSPLEVGRDLVALHSTDPASVYLAAFARLSTPKVSEIEATLYDDRVLIRMLGMRRTMFVVADDLAPVVQGACTRALAVQLRDRYQQILEQTGTVKDVARWWSRVQVATLAALAKRGEATAQQLGQDVPELRTQVRLAVGKNYEGTQSVATWMLMQLSAEGKVVRGRPRGSWISSQYHWAPVEAWLPRGLSELATPIAQARLVGEWLRAFGPGSLQDLKWWTGLTMGEVKRAVATLDVVEVDLGEGPGLVLAEDTSPREVAEPWVSLLPALDPTPMGYLRRDWFLGAHGPALFDRSGNIGPSIWYAGRIVGGWAQRKNGTIASRLFEDIGREAQRQVDQEAERLGRWIGDVRVTPRFRTPLERELSA